MDDEEDAMRLADLALVAFALCNGARVLAYIPQIICAARDRNCANAISLTTWSLLVASNISTSGYAITQLADWTIAGIFAVNTIFGVAVVAVTAWKRLHAKPAPVSPKSSARASRLSFAARTPRVRITSGRTGRILSRFAATASLSANSQNRPGIHRFTRA